MSDAMVENEKIDWVDFYMAFADKLLEFKDNRGELISKIVNIYDELDMKLPTLQMDDNGNTIIPYDIDPFTVFALFNKYIKYENRIKLLKQIKKKFSIENLVPNTFAGVPRANNMSATFYAFDEKRGEDDIDNLWGVFEYAIKLASDNNSFNRENFINYFNASLNQFGVKWNLTIGLFWIRPNNYINLDFHNRQVLGDIDIFSDDFRDEIKSLTKPPLGNQYLKICETCALVIDESDIYDSFADFSHDAFVRDTNKDEKSEIGIGDNDVKTTHYWLNSPGSGACWWDEFYDNGNMGIGFDEIGDLNQYNSKEELKIKFQEIYGNTSFYLGNVNSCWNFIHDMQIGDIVFARKGKNKIIGRGIVESDYEFDESNNNYHKIRKVNWTHKGSWKYEYDRPLTKILEDITSYKEMINNISELFVGEEGVEEPPELQYPQYNIDKFLDEVYIDEDDYFTLVNLVKNKKNLIVEGAPGVGKTFMAKRLAYSIMGVKDVNRVMMVQFHQSYSYEDFVMGYRPAKEGFELRNGSFYHFCKKAEEDSENDYFFIIDEINRGNLSKIFGELFMLIENDKRGEKNKIQLLYSDELFFIPKNVYIIGLMNTADRSLAMIDYALRRRFAFFDLKPGFDSDGFKTYQNELENSNFDDLIEVMNELNHDIMEDESLGEGFRIGHSYLCNIKPDDVEDKLNYVIEYELIPLLKEYWFDEPNKVNNWSARLRSVRDDS